MVPTGLDSGTTDERADNHHPRTAVGKAPLIEPDLTGRAMLRKKS